MCKELSIYQSKNITRRSIPTTTLKRFYIGVGGQMVPLVPLKFMKRIRTFRFPVFLGNPQVSLPGLHKFQVPGVWDSWVGAENN